MAAIVELRRMSDAEINDLLEAAREEMFNLRFQKAGGGLENTARLKMVRREIAQLNEVLHKRQLAIAKAAEHPEIASALEGKKWKGAATYIYEDGAWSITFVDENEKQLATALVDLNSKRRKTRHDRNRAPKKRVLNFEIAG